jgi:translation initiation factor 3 subunit A
LGFYIEMMPAVLTSYDSQLSRNVLKKASPEVRALYNILEVDFHPLVITSKIEPIFAHLSTSPDTARYVEPLKDVVLARLFQQLAQVYDSLKLSRAVRLASFGQEKDPKVLGGVRARVERFIADACRKGQLDVSLDHADGALRFDQDLFGADSAGSAQSDGLDILQPPPSTLLRTQLGRLASALSDSLDTLGDETNAPRARAVRAKSAALAALAAQLPQEREALLRRRLIIARRRELAEEAAARAEKEAQHARALRTAARVEEEQRRERERARAKELAIIEGEQKRVKEAENRKLLESLKAKGAKGVEIDSTKVCFSLYAVMVGIFG